MTNYYEYERKIESMIDELQGLCSQQGLSNTASEEEVVTTVFLYKFLNDKFMYNLNKFGEDIGETVEELLANENDELDAFYDEHSQDVMFRTEDTIESLVKYVSKDNFYEHFDAALERISNYEANDKFKVEEADGTRLPLFTRLSDLVSRDSKNGFAVSIFSIITQEKFQFQDAYENSFDFYSTVFEYLIKNYNVASGTYAEYFTPQACSSIISKILVNMSEIDENKLYEITDFAAGSGSLILHLANELGHGKFGNRARVYTQDISAKSSRFLRLNMMLNGLTESLDNIIKGDTLLTPAHYNVAHDPSSGLKKYDFITINPPFKTDFSSTRDDIEHKWQNTDRFFAGIPNIPKTKKGSMAIYTCFLQHVLYSLKDDGKAAVIVPTGFITAQSGIEKKIREKIVNEHWLKGVISMPSNIFANTGTNISIIFIDKTNQNGEVLLMDASDMGEKVKEGKNQRVVLSDKEVKQIEDIFINHEVVEDRSVSVTYDEIKEKNYSLAAGQYFNVKISYVELTPQEFDKQMNEYYESLSEMFTESRKLESSIMKQIKELNYD